MIYVLSCTSVGLHVVAPRTMEEQSLIDDFIFEKSLFSSYWMRIRHEGGRLGKTLIVRADRCAF